MRVYEILNDLVDEKVLKILSLFSKNEEKQFYLKEISEKTNVSISSVFRILSDLKKKGYIKENKYGPQKLYSLDKSEKGKIIAEIFTEEQDPFEILVSNLKKITEIKKIILYGKLTKKSAKIIVVGENVDDKFVEKVVKDIYENFNFKMEYMILSENQFNQMIRIGMYSEERKQIYPWFYMFIKEINVYC